MTFCAPTGCHCMCHRFPGVKHVVPCCDRCYELDAPVVLQTGETREEAQELLRAMGVSDELPEQPRRCPVCRSGAPSVIGIVRVSGKPCRDAFHCPTPDLHGNPFRYCPNCTWTEAPAEEQILQAQGLEVEDKRPDFLPEETEHELVAYLKHDLASRIVSYPVPQLDAEPIEVRTTRDRTIGRLESPEAFILGYETAIKVLGEALVATAEVHVVTQSELEEMTGGANAEREDRGPEVSG